MKTQWKITGMFFLSITLATLGCGRNKPETVSKTNITEKVEKFQVDGPIIPESMEPQYVEGEMLVSVYADATEADIRELETMDSVISIKRLSPSTLNELDTIPYQIVFEKAASQVFLEETIRSLPFVADAGPHPLYQISVIPDDPSFNQLWGLTKIEAPAAWDKYNDSSDIVVAVIDTGVQYDHPDLSANIWKNPGEIPGNGIDDDKNSFVDDVVGWNFVNGNNSPSDAESHGTHVAGTISAVGNNGVGITGIGWNTKIMALKVGTGRTLSGAAIISAVYYAADNGAKVSNNSYGGSGLSVQIYNAIKYARDKGHIFVAAAGNSNSNNDVSSHEPSNYNLENIIAVAATNENDGKAYFSSYGRNSVDLGAPGTSILSTVPGSTYAFKQGTSMATPHVAGAVAVLWSFAPYLDLATVKQYILESGDPIPALNGITVSGKRLNLRASIQAAAVKRLPPPQNLQLTPGDKEDLTLSWDPIASEEVAGYTVMYSTNNEMIDAVIADVGKNTNFQLANLDTTLVYYFTVFGYDSFKVEGLRAPVISGSPLDMTPPGAIMDLSLHLIDDAHLPLETLDASGEYSAFFGKDKIIDGDVHSGWSPPLRDSPTEEFISFQLGSIKEIDTVEIQALNGLEQFFPNHFDIEVAGDDLLWETVGQGDYTDSGNPFLSITFAPVLASHVQIRIPQGILHQSGNYITAIGEVMVLGPPTEREIEISWTAPGDDNYKGTAQSFDIRNTLNFPSMPEEFNYQVFDTANIVENNIVPGVSGTYHQYVLKNLPGETNVFVAIRSKDEVSNTSELSNIAFQNTGNIPPSGIKDLNASQITEKSVTLSWTASGGDANRGKASKYDIRYSLSKITPKNWDAATKFQQALVPKNAGEKENLMVSGLSANTNYYFIVRALDQADNISSLSNLVLARTDNANDNSAPAAIFDLAAHQEVQQGKLLSVTASVSSGDANGFEKSLTTDFDKNTYWASSVETIALPEKFISFDLGDQKPVGRIRVLPYHRMLSNFPVNFTIQGSNDGKNWFWITSEIDYIPSIGNNGEVEYYDYHFMPKLARYIKIIGEKWYPDDAQNSNLQMIVSEVEIYEADIDLTAVTLTWTAVGDDAYDGKAVKYQLRYNVVAVNNPNQAFFDWNTAVSAPISMLPKVSGSFELFTLTGLKAETRYCIGMKAEDDKANVSSISNVVCINTPDIFPAPIKDLVVMPATKGDSLALQWTATGNNGNDGIAKRYEIRYAMNYITNETYTNAALVPNQLTPKQAGSSENFTVTGLKSETTYYFVVQAFDERNNSSPLSNVAVGTTLDITAPNNVNDIAAHAPIQDSTEPVSASVFFVSSSENANSVAEKAIDSDLNTEWISEGKENKEIEAIILKLDLAREIERVKLLPSKAFPQLFPVSFTVRISQDSQTWKTVAQANDYFGQLIKEAEFTFKPVMAQYVRIDITETTVSSGEYFAAIAEIQIYAKLDRTDEIELSWSAPGDSGVIGSATSYDIRYNTNPIDANSWVSSVKFDLSQIPTPKSSGQLQRTWVTGLQTETLYYFALKSKDELGNESSLSNIAQARTNGIPPAKIDNLVADNPTENSITLSWTAPGDDQLLGQAKSYEIYYAIFPISLENLNTANKVTNTLVPAVSGSKETFIVSSLKPGIRYFFAVIAVDKAQNRGKISNVPSVETLDPPEKIPPASITDLAAFAKQDLSGEILLTWTAPGDDGLDGRAEKYDIRMSKTPINSINDFNSASIVAYASIPKPAGVSEQLTLKGLTIETLYYFAIRTIDDSNNVSALSNVPSVWTLRIKPGMVIDLSAINITSSGFDLKWTASGDDENVGTVSKYIIKISSSIITQSNWDAIGNTLASPQPLSAGSVQTFTVSEYIDKNGKNQPILFDTTYNVALRAIDDAGEMSGISNLVTFKTLDGVPPDPIGDLKAQTGENNGTVQLNWTATGDNGLLGRATSYEIRYAKDNLSALTFDNATLVNNPPAPADAGTPQSFLITDLSYEGIFCFGIRVIDDNNNKSLVSNIACSPTKEVPPGKVYTLKVVGQTAHSLTLQWISPGDNLYLGTADHYEMRYSDEMISSDILESPGLWNALPQVINLPSPLVAGTVQSFEVKQLSDDSTYYFAMVSYDSRGNRSILSNIAVGTTTDIIPPDPISNLSAKTGDWLGSIRLEWYATGDDHVEGQAASYEVRWSLSNINAQNFANANKVESKKPAKAGAKESISIGSLPHETLIYAAMRVTDESGNVSALSNIVSARTGEYAPSNTNITIVKRDLNAITISWIAPGDNGMEGGKANYYELRYRYEEIPVCPCNKQPIGSPEQLATLIPNPPAPIEPGSKQTFVVSNLLPNQTYIFYLRTFDNRPVPNVSGWATSKLTSTLDPYPPFDITSLAASTPTENRTEISIDSAGASSYFSAAWSPGYLTDNNIYSHWASSAKKSSEVEETITFYLSGERQIAKVSMTASPDYFDLFPKDFEIQVSDIKNPSLWLPIVEKRKFSPNGNEPNEFTFTPINTKKVRIVMRSASQYLDSYFIMFSDFKIFEAPPVRDTIIVTWAAPGDDGNTGNVTSYDLRMSKQPINISNFELADKVRTETPLSAGLFEEYQISKLQSETTYYFAIRAVDEEGNWSNISNITSATTLGVPPGKITDLSLSQIYITNNTYFAELKWTAPGSDDYAGQATKYDLYYSPEPLSEANLSQAIKADQMISPNSAGAEEIFTISGLIDEQEYYVGIITFDQSNNRSVLSNVLTFITPPGPDPIPPASIQTLTARLPYDTIVTLSASALSATSQNFPYFSYTRFTDADISSDWATYPSSVDTEAEVDVDVSDYSHITQPVQDIFPLGRPKLFSAIQLHPSTGLPQHFPLKFEIWVRQNLDTEWTLIKTVDEPNTPTGWKEYSFDPVEARFIKMRTIESRKDPASQMYFSAIAEIKVLGYPSTNRNDVILTWVSTGDDMFLKTATEYDIRVLTELITEQNFASAIQLSSIPVPRVSGSLESISVTNLAANANYYFALKVKDDVGNWSPLSNVVMVHTP